MKNPYDQMDIDGKLIWNFRDIGHTMRQIYEGKGSQQRILMILKEAGCMPQSDLTQRLGIQPGSASEVISKLEAAEWIIRTPNEKDKRTMNIQLTQAGELAAQQAAIRRRERHTRMFESLSGEDKAELLSFLERINADWDDKFRGSPQCESRWDGQRHHGHHGGHDRDGHH